VNKRLLAKFSEKGIIVNVLVNNRAGDNALLVAQIIAEKFLGSRKEDIAINRFFTEIMRLA
jgi:hypothetical protein